MIFVAEGGDVDPLDRIRNSQPVNSLIPDCGETSGTPAGSVLHALTCAVHNECNRRRNHARLPMVQGVPATMGDQLHPNRSAALE